MSILDMEHIGIADPQDKPIDWVADCTDPFCEKPIHHGDRCIIDENGDHYCNERCYIGASGAKLVHAGTEEYAF